MTRRKQRRPLNVNNCGGGPRRGEKKVLQAHTYEILPRIAARFAPVADGIPDGFRFQVWKASSANATASFASDGTPNSSDRRILSPNPSTCSAIIRMSVALL